MRNRLVLEALVCLVCVAVSTAGPIEDAMYADFFDRAAALLPGRTTLERDLLRNPETSRTGDHYGDNVARELNRRGTWDVSGGGRVAEQDGIGVDAREDRAQLTWKLTDPDPHPRFSMSLHVNIETPVPLRVLFHVGGDDYFNRVGDWVDVEPGQEQPMEFHIRAPSGRDAGRDFSGVRLMFEGENLAGQKVMVRNPRLTSEFCEGFFRHTVELPAGEIWEAVAEVGESNTLYVNGKRVEDESIILPRPVSGGHAIYRSRRVPLRAYLKPGRNVVALHVMLAGRTPAAYLRGSVVMASGERILLDTGMNWVWNRVAPEDWHDTDYDDSGWLQIFDQGDMPRSLGLGYGYRGSEAVASTASNYGLSSRPRGSRPCYDGFIKLHNPSDSKLYFRENAPFRLRALIPSGLGDRAPEMVWEISQYAADGTFTSVANGRTAEFKPIEDSLETQIAAEGLSRGIYVLTGRLMLDGEVAEEREPEIMVVTGKVPMKKAAGDFWEQGLDLTLEKVVDFTDPDDPHPWFETDHKGPIPSARWGTNYYHTVEPALIVERNGLTYRVTRPVNRAQFSYKVDFEHAGDWYLLVLEYPDDAERWIGVSCNANRTPDHLRRVPPEQRYSASSKCGPTIWTGGKYPNTGKMLEMKWIYRPDPGSHSINVMSLMKKTEAAAARLRVYHINGHLPELEVGAMPAEQQRRFGMVTERTYPWGNGIYNLFSSFDSEAVHGNGDRGAGHYSRNPIVDGCEFLRLLEDAAGHYAEYMRFSGQNVHAMGCFQYSDANTASQWVTGSSRIHNSSEDMLARVLAANDLMFYASVEYVSTKRFALAANKPEWFFADRRGNRPMSRWAGNPLNLNFLNPEVEEEMFEVARQLAQGFKYQSNFLGVNWTALLSGFFIPSYRKHTYPYNYEEDPLGNGYDDMTVGMFEEDTGIDVPGGSAGIDADGKSDPDVCEQRYQFLTSPEIKPAWMAWRSRKMAEFFANVSREISEIRPGLETVASCYMIAENIEEWKRRGISFEAYLESWGWDPKAFSDKESVWLMPWLPVAARYGPAARKANYAIGWQGNKDPDFYRPFRELNRRAIMLTANWIEVERIAANYPYREGWPRPYQQTMMAQQREEMAMEPYTQAMIGFDPQMIMMGFTDVSPYIGVEGMQRRFARVLRRLPWGRFERVLDTGFDTDLVIRALRQDGAYYFYVANPAYWPISGTVSLEGAGRVTDLVSGTQAPMDQGVVAVDIEPFGIVAFRAEGQGNRESDIRVSAWTAAPPGENDLDHLRGIINRAASAAANPDMAEFLGHVDYEVITQGIDDARTALSEGRYARAWAVVTEAPFWTAVHQKAPEIKYVEITRPRELTAVQVEASEAPVIDGKLDEAVWQQQGAGAADRFVTKEKAYSKLKTRVSVARAGTRLFIAVWCPDPEPESIRGTTDKNNVRRTIWGSRDDLIAFFIMPEGATKEETHYYQMAVTANGARFDQHNRIKHGLHVRNYDYAPEWKAAVGRTKNGWVVEAEFDTAEAFGVPLREGAVWKLNVHRQFRLDQYPMSSWSFNPGRWHSMEHMGTMTIE